jgi:hypothetical protein
VADREAEDVAAALVTQICADGGSDPRGLVLHSDNGAPMRGSMMIATLQWLGVIPSFSRPHVSDDNPYSEALFRTLKHTPAYPQLPFADLASANRWVARFVDWYNGAHRHSAIRYVTPDERHDGNEREVLANRHELYERARRANPERWSRSTRNWVAGRARRAPSRTAASSGRSMIRATTTLTLTGSPRAASVIMRAGTSFRMLCTWMPRSAWSRPMHLLTRSNPRAGSARW